MGTTYDVRVNGYNAYVDDPKFGRLGKRSTYGYTPAIAYHPAGGYGYNKYGAGTSYTYRSTQGLHKREAEPASTAIPMVLMPTMATSMWRGTRMMVMAMATTRGRLSPATPLLSLTTPLVATATTSTALATPTPIGLPRVFTRGRLPARATST